MLKPVLLLALVCASNAFSFQRRSEGKCAFKGQEYSVGTFYDGCKKCECHKDGGVACVSCPLTQDTTCTLKGTEYKVGTFYDGCHRCECHSDGSIGCVGCPITNGGRRETTCSFGGKEYPVGKFMDGQNTCTCDESGHVGCVGTGTHADKDCTHKGKTHKSNTIWIEKCNMCTCEDGLVGCTSKACDDASDEKDYPDEEPGCTYKGKSYMHGQIFFDGCEECSCDSGDVKCKKDNCPDLSRSLIEALKRRLRELH